MKVKCVICDQIETLSDDAPEAKKLRNRPIHTFMCQTCYARIDPGDRAGPEPHRGWRSRENSRANCCGVDADFNVWSAGSSCCSISVKSLPNGKADSSPESAGGLQGALDGGRRVVRARLCTLERPLDLAGILGLPKSSSWNRESVIASIAAMTSRSLLPRMSAMPYSVTTMSRRWRGMVVWP